MFSLSSSRGAVERRRTPQPESSDRDERAKFLKKYKTTLYEAYGTVMKEYAAVPDSLLEKTQELKQYLDLSYKYAKTLKPKPTKKKR